MDAMQNGRDVLTHPCFNPRARDGRDLRCHFLLSAACVSIHAPVMDAIGDLLVRPVIRSFNPRARDGRDYVV